jgi:molybdenum cofactor synthesis domain-containing protein
MTYGGSILKKIRVEEAVGMILGHDLTKILPGKFKGAAFKKGYIIREEDIEVLKDMGKYHIYAVDLNEDYIHEDEAAIRIGRAVAGEGLYLEGPSEGKVSLKSKYKGLLKINLKALEAINNIDLIVLATLHNNTLVEQGRTVAGTRIIPLTIKEERVKEVEKICSEHGAVISLNKMRPVKVGIVVTGNEVYEGRVSDKFGPVLRSKINKYGVKLLDIEYVPDRSKKIQKAIKSLIGKGAEVVLAAGGMSVDADDVTPDAIKKVSSKVITYGSPVLPGAMFMLAYTEKAAILGIPACGMYSKTTVLDLILPRVLIGESLSKGDIVKLAHGGLCLSCEECRYPTCPFGK